MPENEQPQVEVTGPATIVTEPATPARTIDELIADRERVRRESLVAPYTTSTDPYRMARNRDKLYRMAQTEANYGNPDLAQFYISKANEIDTRRQEINTAQENARRALASTRDVDDFTRPVTGFFKKLWRNTNPFDKRKLYWAAGAAVGTFESAAFTLLLGPVGGWVKAGVNALILNALSWNKKMYDGDNRATRMGSFVSGMAAASIGYAAYKLFTEPLASQNCDNAERFERQIIDAVPKYGGGIPELADDIKDFTIDGIKGAWHHTTQAVESVWKGYPVDNPDPKYYFDGWNDVDSSLLRSETYSLGGEVDGVAVCDTCGDGVEVVEQVGKPSIDHSTPAVENPDINIVEPCDADWVYLDKSFVNGDLRGMDVDNDGDYEYYLTDIVKGDTITGKMIENDISLTQENLYRVFDDNKHMFIDNRAHDTRTIGIAENIVNNPAMASREDLMKAMHWIYPADGDLRIDASLVREP